MPLVFDRNASSVPVGVRIVDIAWGVAGLSSIYDGSPVRIPTSAYSISVSLARLVDFWDADATAIGEDMHMALKAYLVRLLARCPSDGSGHGRRGRV